MCHFHLPPELVLMTFPWHLLPFDPPENIIITIISLNYWTDRTTTTYCYQ